MRTLGSELYIRDSCSTSGSAGVTISHPFYKVIGENTEPENLSPYRVHANSESLCSLHFRVQAVRWSVWLAGENVCTIYIVHYRKELQSLLLYPCKFGGEFRDIITIDGVCLSNAMLADVVWEIPCQIHGSTWREYEEIIDCKCWLCSCITNLKMQETKILPEIYLGHLLSNTLLLNNNPLAPNTSWVMHGFCIHRWTFNLV